MSTNNNNNTENSEEFDQTKAGKSRKKGFLLLVIAVLIAGAGYKGYNHFAGTGLVSTNNAYVAAEIAIITPATNGIVAEINVVDTQYVLRGDILIVIDDIDAKLALQQAEAKLALAKRRVRRYLANDKSFEALVKAREADEERAASQLLAAKAYYERAKVDLERRKRLISSGSVSGEELSNAKTAFTQAKANWNAAKATASQSLATRLATMADQKANAVLTDNSSIETNAEVLLAKVHYEQAKINLERTVICSPINGVIAKRQVQIGRSVQIGTPLLTVVPLDNMHINANFKEVELRDIRIGQAVTAISDLHGDKVVYTGVVGGFSGGTGAAFSLIPAQNATGNWIKVVQRLPIRIELNEKELSAHPLKVGLSMEVTVDTHSATEKS